MSNPRNTTRLPLRSSIANKGKAQTSTNDLLERKTRTLEGNLNKPKFTTQREQSKSTMDIYRRGKPAGIKAIIKCGQCEKEDAKMRCLECVEVYCTNCYSQFHLRGALQRHHSVLLPTFPKKMPAGNPDLQLPEQGEVQTDKTGVASFQQSFLQWREENIHKSKRLQQKRGLSSPIHNRIDDSNKLPYLDSNSSKITADDSVLLKKSQTPANQRTGKRDQSNINVRVRIHHSFSDRTSLVDTLEPLKDDSKPHDELIPVEETVFDDHELPQIEEQERPYTHISAKSSSRPPSSSMKRDFVPSRSNSITLPEQPLRSDLAGKSTEELEEILNTKLNLSRASSARSENLDAATSWRPSQSTSNNINAQSVAIDRIALAQFDSALDELFDESKIELAYQLDSAKDQPSGRAFDTNSNTVTPRRHSAFSFSNSLYKMSRINSASSRDTGEGGFFTDVVHRQPIPTTPPPLLPPPILECSTSNEWRNTSENQPTEPDSIPLPKLSIPSLLPSASKDSIKKKETDNDSRPGSSLSSSSLPISISSSKPGFDNAKGQSSATSSRKSSSSTSTTTAKVTSSSSSTTLKDTSSSSTTAKDTTTTTTSSSSAETKTSSAPTTTSKETTSEYTSSTTTNSSSATTLKNVSSQPEPIITAKDEKEVPTSIPDEHHQESIDSLNDKKPSHAQLSEDPDESLEPPSITYLTRGMNITEKDLPTKKKARRPNPTSDEPSHFRKLEFSMGDGLHWQEASTESLSSTKTIISKRVFTPSNPVNTKVGEQFSKYDNDDGRTSVACQNMNDEECFHQLCQEFCSELDTKGSDEDALLNEHILNILQNVRRPFHEQDVPNILPDNELLIHD